jgi:hypothetical protein
MYEAQNRLVLPSWFDKLNVGFANSRLCRMLGIIYGLFMWDRYARCSKVCFDTDLGCGVKVSPKGRVFTAPAAHNELGYCDHGFTAPKVACSSAKNCTASGDACIWIDSQTNEEKAGRTCAATGAINDIGGCFLRGGLLGMTAADKNFLGDEVFHAQAYVVDSWAVDIVGGWYRLGAAHTQSAQCPALGCKCMTLALCPSTQPLITASVSSIMVRLIFLSEEPTLIVGAHLSRTFPVYCMQATVGT